MEIRAEEDKDGNYSNNSKQKAKMNEEERSE
eukprot:CAMPEP_0206619468 /NCGR_PEP_ID=MMETSP0325_2-20121206/60846_1 /ASSEMBLY_ACC=CAM_ASM_000347 /TAXON_ID=2866 /ORGANISM="Crypthecodinium cohnii, Strain Seligo" /LENGTH=30 /DNA_ID= /DNA_START= /DNA_END= /DNA_ORIENTATION=